MYNFGTLKYILYKRRLARSFLVSYAHGTNILSFYRPVTNPRGTWGGGGIPRLKGLYSILILPEP